MKKQYLRAVKEPRRPHRCDDRWNRCHRIVWPAAPFFFMHGKDATIPKDTEITAYTNGEIKLDRAKILGKAGNWQ